MAKCKWILYDYRTICPEGHTDVCDGSLSKPYFRLVDNYKEVMSRCPFCKLEIDYSYIDKAIEKRGFDNEL